MVSLDAVVTPAPGADWRQVWRRDPNAMITQSPEWLACVCQVGPYADASRLYVFSDGRRVVLPLARARRLPARLAPADSWPFDWGVGGALADGPVDERHTIAVYADLARRRPASLTIRTGPLAPLPWRAAPPAFGRTEHTTYLVDLTGGFDTVWRQRFHGRARTAVRKAEAAGLDIDVDHTGRLVPEFDRLYRLSVDRWAAAQHEPVELARWHAARANPAGKFHTVAERLGDRCAVWVARYRGRTAAAIIVLSHGAHAHYWHSAMDPDLDGPTCANALLQHLAIEAACMAGATTYHMGEGRPGSDLAAFKAGFGAEPHTAVTYRIERLLLSRLHSCLRRSTRRCLRLRDP